VLGSDHDQKITPDERHRLAAADDLDCAFELVELASGQEPGQPGHMIQMQVGQQYVAEPAEPELGAHQLALGPFAAID
jgi:hypothetical protein